MGMTTLIPLAEFQRVQGGAIGWEKKLRLLADMARVNALSAVKRAGSGHLGSSFSAMDIVVWLYYQRMNTVSIGFDSFDRDIYFSSKGHDVPGLYAVLFALGVLPRERFLKLRRLGGLDGHPDVGIPGIEANSGSLGMGISKGKGMAWAKKRGGRRGRVFVMLGDGELQEGQNYEAMRAARHQAIDNLTVIVDYNKVQSDKLTSEIMDLGDLVTKFEAFGWDVERVNGHDIAALDAAADRLSAANGRPKAIVADTVKGRGVSFMEHPAALAKSNGLYPWHAGAPDDASYRAAHNELVERIEQLLAEAGLEALTVEHIGTNEAAGRLVKASELEGEPVSQAAVRPSSVSDEYVAKAYGAALLAAMERRPDIVVLDADLASDCRIREIEQAYPERFIENGIAEQDMVSMAGGLARQGLLPVVNSFASFLASRANEQIYNNASERSKIIYAMHYAGMIPAGPGKSHQSIRDISLIGALPDTIVVQPGSAAEAAMLLDYCIDTATETCAIRLAIGPSPRRIELPADYRAVPGRGVRLREGDGGVLLAYGPVMLHEALVAHERLAAEGFGLEVVNMPWLNRVDPEWLRECLGSHAAVFVLDDHAPVGGLADRVRQAMIETGLAGDRLFASFAVEGWPACGTPQEALRVHRLDGESLAHRIESVVTPSVPSPSGR
jgi:transketolase